MGVIGSDDPEASSVIQLVMKEYDIPQISPSSSADKLSDKNNYPTFLRVVSRDDTRGEALASIAKYFNWVEVAVIATADEYGNKGMR